MDESHKYSLIGWGLLIASLVIFFVFISLESTKDYLLAILSLLLINLSGAYSEKAMKKREVRE